MIPDFEVGTGNLPPGVHAATWEEVVDRYGYNPKRSKQLEGLKLAIDDLKRAGCRVLYLDGSFVTAKEQPGDYDACWEAEHVNADDLHPTLLDVGWNRKKLKARYGGDITIVHLASEPFGETFMTFFQTDRDGNPKGLLRIDLQELQ